MAAKAAVRTCLAGSKPINRGLIQAIPTSLPPSSKANWEATKLLKPSTNSSLEYCPPSMTAKQLEDIHNFKQYAGLGANIKSSSSNDELAALVNKLDNLGRDMKKLKESVYAIQVGCQICKGPHLDKDCPLNEEVKQIEEVRYGEFRRTTHFNGSNGGKFRVEPPGYYTKIDNRPPYGEKRQSLEELLAEHQDESTRRSTEIEIEQLTKEIHSDKTLNSSSEQIKTVTADQETSGLNKLIRVSFISGPKSDTPEVLQHQLPPKELNPGSFTLPCTIAKYGKSKTDALVWDNRYAEWYDISPSFEASSQESNKPRPRDYTFREWILIKVGHTDISEPVKKAILKLWLIDCFQDNSAFENNPTHRSFDDYKWELNLEIDKLADEYELGIGKKGHILDDIWEYLGIEDKDYHPPEVQVETFEVKKYSFKGGQSFICVTKDVENILPLGRKNESKFKEMIQKEV
ncbi:hypothetical protein Tco_0544090 [Tanacetum coccineum]